MDPGVDRSSVIAPGFASDMYLLCTYVLVRRGPYNTYITVLYRVVNCPEIGAPPFLARVKEIRAICAPGVDFQLVQIVKEKVDKVKYICSFR